MTPLAVLWYNTKHKLYRVLYIIKYTNNYEVHRSVICDVAADNSRPYLTSFQGNAFTDYINAVFVDVSSRLGLFGLARNHLLWARQPL